MIKGIKKIFGFLIFPYWVIIEAVYGLRFGVMLSLFIAIGLSLAKIEYRFIFGVLVTVVIGGMLSILGGSYFYLKTRNMFIESEMNILESEIETLPTHGFSGIPSPGMDENAQKPEDDSIKLSFIRTISFLIGAVPIFTPYLFSVDRLKLVKIVVLFSFIILLIIGIVEGKIRGQNRLKNVFKEIGLGIILVMFAYFWGEYLASFI